MPGPESPEVLEAAFESHFQLIDGQMEKLASFEVTNPRELYRLCDEAVKQFGYDRTYDEFQKRHGEAENFVYKNES